MAEGQAGRGGFRWHKVPGFLLPQE